MHHSKKQTALWILGIRLFEAVQCVIFLHGRAFFNFLFVPKEIKFLDVLLEGKKSQNHKAFFTNVNRLIRDRSCWPKNSKFKKRNSHKRNIWRTENGLVLLRVMFEQWSPFNSLSTPNFHWPVMSRFWLLLNFTYDDVESHIIIKSLFLFFCNRHRQTVALAALGLKLFNLTLTNCPLLGRTQCDRWAVFKAQAGTTVTQQI